MDKAKYWHQLELPKITTKQNKVENRAYDYAAFLVGNNIEKHPQFTSLVVGKDTVTLTVYKLCIIISNSDNDECLDLTIIVDRKLYKRRSRRICGDLEGLTFTKNMKATINQWVTRYYKDKYLDIFLRNYSENKPKIQPFIFNRKP